MRLLLPLIVLELLSLKLCAASQPLLMNPDKRLKAVISCDSMNRLAVANDRITQIFGDNDAYEVQTEESTGQLFLKPTAENGKKPLSVTLITENGATQDMTLQPEEREATTVILKNGGTGTETLIDATGGLGAFPSAHAASFKHAGQSVARQGVTQGQGDFSYNTAYGMQSPGFGAALGFQDQVIQAMKFLVSGSAPIIDVDGVKRNAPKGVEVNLISAFNLANFKGLKLHVKNSSETSIDILEKDFLQTNDLALSFEKRVLQAGEATILYVVVR
jgi:hypothetical protein